MVRPTIFPYTKNNYLGYQNCLATKRHTTFGSIYRKYTWFDDDCYQKKFYICERRGWYCWGWTCWLKYNKLQKAEIPLDAAKARKAATDERSSSEKVDFEE